MMPGMDGFELARRVKRIADLPIIVLSSVDASESKVRALEEYAEDYITKPFEPDELVARVQRVMRRTAAGRARGDARRRRGRDRPLEAADVTVAGTHALTRVETRLLELVIGLLDWVVPTRRFSSASGRRPMAPTRRTCGSRGGGCGASWKTIRVARGTWSPSAGSATGWLRRRASPSADGGALVPPSARLPRRGRAATARGVRDRHQRLEQGDDY